MKRNLTIQLDEEVVREAKVLAAKRGTSVSSLLAHYVTKMTSDRQRYEEAKTRALKAMDSAVDRGGVTWTREELYDR
ncbi:DUF6364 family protein [Actinocrispum wychmicini]|uniref:Ribbon-helix-helix CopG family protein n=1 Tax=Actinocrispum wychmicini TaxID=1213861 RepID=A0A4R2JFQ5_9PSEU|nr:DUF6364 family protein [Actinocrispum wychmicini]TCO58583.1 hypothetical protein EV192_105654 [Actinocrispum wychmicini]